MCLEIRKKYIRLLGSRVVGMGRLLFPVGRIPFQGIFVEWDFGPHHVPSTVSWVLRWLPMVLRSTPRRDVRYLSHSSLWLNHTSSLSTAKLGGLLMFLPFLGGSRSYFSGHDE